MREIDKRIRDCAKSRSTWTHEGYLWTHIRDISDGMVLKCKETRCNAQMRKLGEELFLEANHTHGPDHDLVAATEAIYVIKRRGLGKSAREIERIHEEVCQELR